MPDAASSRDADELAQYGYRQRLDRSLGSFSSFAAGFSYLSILTGLPQLFYLGYGAGGPAFFWTWPLVFAGQFLVALCFAEQAAHYPLSGGVYQWSKRLGPRWLGWMAGWVYLCCAIVTLASVALAWQATLPQLWPGFQIIGDRNNPADAARNGVLLGCLMLAASTVINSVGVRLLARINNAGVFAEIVGAVALIGLLAWAARRGPEIVFDTHGLGAGRSLGYLGPFLTAALTASFVFYGFDTAGSLAEETDDPRRRAPRAILLALVAVAITGALLILGALRAVADPNDPNLGSLQGGMPYVITQALGPAVGRPLLVVIATAVFVCTLTVHAAAVRLVFAMARDNNLPFSRVLARVSDRSQTPTGPAVVLGLAAMAMLVANVDFPQLMEVLASVSIVWANLAYLLVTLPLLIRRSRSNPYERVPHRSDVFKLGRWGKPINALAVVWSLALVINIGWPRAEIYGETYPRRLAAPLATTAMLLAGVVAYAALQRRRAEILAEHRAGQEDPQATPRPELAVVHSLSR